MVPFPSGGGLERLELFDEQGVLVAVAVVPNTEVLHLRCRLFAGEGLPRPSLGHSRSVDLVFLVVKSHLVLLQGLADTGKIPAEVKGRLGRGVAFGDEDHVVDAVSESGAGAVLSDW